MKKDKSIIIIGGGLSGLSLAYFLAKQNIQSTILEGSSRLGGRIQTIKGNLGTPLELGATWFTHQHHNLLELLSELEIEKYNQYSEGKSLFQVNSSEPPQVFFTPKSETPSYRIAGGSEALILALADNLKNQTLVLDCKLEALIENGKKIILKTSEDRIFKAHKVIVCLPPKLACSSISFSPDLPEEIFSVLPQVQTWMAGSIKFVLEFESPFWRKKGYSGIIFSHVGIIAEMYDHTNFEEDHYGFTGFLNSAAISYTQKERQGFVINQLSKLIGEEVLKFTSYHDKVWSDEFIANEKTFNLRPHQNNGHPVFYKSYMNDKLYFSGTESSPEFSGYMEGAIISAKNMLHKIVN